MLYFVDLRVGYHLIRNHSNRELQMALVVRGVGRDPVPLDPPLATRNRLVSLEMLKMGLFDFFRRKPISLWDALQSSTEFQKQKELFDAMSAMCEDGIDANEMPNATGEYGLVATNPIPSKTVFGSTAYLGRLRAADGTKVMYRRRGSIIQSSVSKHPIDVYEVTHSTGQKLATLYISPYQKRISGKAPRGFMLAENSFGGVSGP